MIYIGILATIFVLFLLYGYLSNYFLSVTSYPIQDRRFLQDPIRICFLSDLHCCQFGKNNCRLIKKIQELNPDVILISGDLIVKNGRHTERALGLLKELSLCYPVYYSPGNHEIKMPGYEEYRRRVRAMGISYLENQTAEMGNAQISQDLAEAEIVHEGNGNVSWQKAGGSLYDSSGTQSGIFFYIQRLGGRSDTQRTCSWRDYETSGAWWSDRPFFAAVSSL